MMNYVLELMKFILEIINFAFKMMNYAKIFRLPGCATPTATSFEHTFKTTDALR